MVGFSMGRKRGADLEIRLKSVAWDRDVGLVVTYSRVRRLVMDVTERKHLIQEYRTELLEASTTLTRWVQS
ncbi:hypothetical protein [Actinomadura macra]|uniref:hypothetical protein n=1 Tax=Actinomadura macra TaxID=46164 RepID=UPI000A61ABE6|nr:hypothetical protein [Actinomadura macra]